MLQQVMTNPGEDVYKRQIYDIWWFTTSGTIFCRTPEG